MSAYVVPPKQVVSYLGQNYGAGDTVPGYVPVEKTEPKPKAAKQVIVPPSVGTEGATNGRISP